MSTTADIEDIIDANVSNVEDEDTDALEDFKIGTRAKDDDDAYRKYCKFAIMHVFNVRKFNIRLDGEKNIRQRDFVCACEGFSKTSKNPTEPKKINRVVTRTGCKAFVRFMVNSSGVWEVSQLNNGHNHEMVKPKERHFLKINRNIDHANGSIISAMVDAGISGTQAYSYFVKELGGVENVGFTKRDCQNFVNRRRVNTIERGDAQTVINRFKNRLVEDHMFYHSEELDEDGRLENFFWRDGTSKFDYETFGDVVIFDTTYRTNKYNMIFAPFIGINHHRKTILFACAFLLDETTESFTWLFETFLEAMGNRPPRTIFTDQCQAMANAIKKVFPTSCHRLCSWHISKNAVQRLGSLYSNNQFRVLFYHCLYDCETEEEFQYVWDQMIAKFNLSENKWLQSLYKIRAKWCPGFSFDTFTLHIQSTQRSESMNNVFHMMSKKTMNLTEFYEHYEDQCQKMRVAEQQEDVRCKLGTPQIAVKGSKILMQAAKVYTVTIYYLFSQEFVSSLVVHLNQISCIDTLYKYQARDEAHNRSYMVEFNSSTSTVVCTCKLFESVGWMCHHALKVLNSWSCTEIPEQYILSRWTKFAKKEIPEQDHLDSSIEENISLTLERNILMQQAYKSINQLIITSEGRKVAKRKIKELCAEAESIMECGASSDFVSKRADDIQNSSDNRVVLNPARVREKGVTNARIKSSLEKKIRKKNGKDSGKRSNLQNISRNYGSTQIIQKTCPLPIDTLGVLSNANSTNERVSKELNRSLAIVPKIYCN